jgi:hypothetical protein
MLLATYSYSYISSKTKNLCIFDNNLWLEKPLLAFERVKHPTYDILNFYRGLRKEKRHAVDNIGSQRGHNNWLNNATALITTGRSLACVPVHYTPIVSESLWGVVDCMGHRLSGRYCVLISHITGRISHRIAGNKDFDISVFERDLQLHNTHCYRHNSNEYTFYLTHLG